jgi:hypothetical protein
LHGSEQYRFARQGWKLFPHCAQVAALSGAFTPASELSDPRENIGDCVGAGAMAGIVRLMVMP